MTAPAIRLGSVTVAYDRQPALCDVSVSFATGSLTAVVGLASAWMARWLWLGGPLLPHFG